MTDRMYFLTSGQIIGISKLEINIYDAKNVIFFVSLVMDDISPTFSSVSEDEKFKIQNNVEENLTFSH